MDTPKTWLITGCSGGLGQALAAAVLAHGDNVVATARRVEAVSGFAAADTGYPDTCLPLALDVTDAAQRRAAVEQAEAHFGRVDVLVNNAGYGLRAAVEEASEQEVQALFDTHVFGPLDLVREVLPGMRERRSGTIVNFSSLGATVPGDGSGHYSAAKAAVEVLTASLRQEVAPLGITAFAVEPGGFETGFMNRSLQQSATVIDDYADTVGYRRDVLDPAVGVQPGEPAKAAQALIEVVESGRAPELFLMGSDAVTCYREAAARHLAEVDDWESLSVSTDRGRQEV